MGSRRPLPGPGSEIARLWREIEKLRAEAARNTAGVSGGTGPGGGGGTTTRIRVDPDQPRRVLVTTDIPQSVARRLRLAPSTLVREDPTNPRRVLLTLTEET